MAAMNINKAQFDEMIRGEKPVLVDFWAPWCTYCRRIGPAYERVAQEYGDRITVAKVDIDGEKQLADLEGIEVIPTLVLYRNGKPLNSIVAPGSKAEIDRFIRETLGE